VIGPGDISQAIVELATMHPDEHFREYVYAALVAHQLGVTLPTGLKHAQQLIAQGKAQAHGRQPKLASVPAGAGDR
jgi:predicted transcriptional regulator